jgi:hypothetical protein
MYMTSRVCAVVKRLRAATSQTSQDSNLDLTVLETVARPIELAAHVLTRNVSQLLRVEKQNGVVAGGEMGEHDHAESAPKRAPSDQQQG